MEKWVNIPGYENYYQASNLGNVRRVKYYDAASKGHHDCMRNMKFHESSGGYMRVKLTMLGIEKLYLVHRLISQAFIPNPNNFPCVNHKDGNKTHNYVENLEWCSYLYNNNHANVTGLRVMKNKKGSKPVYRFNISGVFVDEFPSANEAGRCTGFAASHIQDCCNDKCRTWKGYIWRWAENCAEKTTAIRPHGNSKSVRQ